MSVSTSENSSIALLGGGSDYKIPRITLSISGLVLLFTVSALEIPSLLNLLSFNYEAILDRGEYWRLITGHLTHSSWDHLFWDWITFTAAGCYLEYHSRKILLTGLLVCTSALNLFLLSPLSDIAAYTGISGTVYTLITLTAFLWARLNKQRYGQLIAYLPLVLIVGKTALELLSGTAVFMNDGWQVYYPAHLVGLFTAFVIYFSMRPGKD
ncbi:rhombosortase [Neptuniibacter sp.]|uniref:rhombosortase n=1 Tax=Neptuniibacter sp. TaxID=1962643 RepID=UPI0026042937|nr:rhombosortase [Neptuniibacter sp.]MCP4595306.1 rhombosortase [Neptuniibacter sp.]